MTINNTNIKEIETQTTTLSYSSSLVDKICQLVFSTSDTKLNRIISFLDTVSHHTVLHVSLLMIFGHRVSFPVTGIDLTLFLARTIF
jgi:hypothetical protein